MNAADDEDVAAAVAIGQAGEEAALGETELFTKMEEMSQDLGKVENGEESEKLAELLHGLYVGMAQTQKQNQILANRVAQLEGEAAVEGVQRMELLQHVAGLSEVSEKTASNVQVLSGQLADKADRRQVESTISGISELGKNLTELVELVPIATSAATNTSGGGDSTMAKSSFSSPGPNPRRRRRSDNSRHAGKARWSEGRGGGKRGEGEGSYYNLPSVVPRAAVQQAWGVSGQAFTMRSRGSVFARRQSTRRGNGRGNSGRSLSTTRKAKKVAAGAPSMLVRDAMGASGGMHPKLDEQLQRQWPSIQNSSGNLSRPGVGRKASKIG